MDTGKAYVACTQPRKIAAVGLAQFVGSHLDQGSNSQAISGIDILSWTKVDRKNRTILVKVSPEGLKPTIDLKGAGAAVTSFAGHQSLKKERNAKVVFTTDSSLLQVWGEDKTLGKYREVQLDFTPEI